jgi:hypothetical protein
LALGAVVATGILSVGVAAAIAMPRGWLVFAGLGAVAAVLVSLVAPPEALLGATAVVFGTFQLSDAHPIHAGSLSLYSTDLLLALLLTRAVSWQDRRPGGLKLHPLVKALAVTVAVLFVYADWKGRQSGLPLRSLVRIPLALFFFPLYIFAFSRILRERSLDLPRLYRTLGGVALAFIAFMLAARIAGKTFATTASFSQNSNGYKVVTADGTLLRRDYGFPSAFILYPVLALEALAFAIYSKTRSNWALAMAIAGSIATLLTLIRGEIFGLAIGAFVLYLIRPKTSRLWTPRRAQSLVVVFAAVAVGAFAISVTSPALATGLAERTLPGVFSQGTYAQKTADDRVQAFSAGYKMATEHPLGIGFRDAATLTAETSIDPLYVTHSTPSWLLVFTGWPGFIAGFALVLACLVASFFAPSREPWHHPAFVAAGLFFLVYSFGAFGLVGQPWVIGVASLLVALRFTEISEPAA